MGDHYDDLKVCSGGQSLLGLCVRFLSLFFYAFMLNFDRHSQEETGKAVGREIVRHDAKRPGWMVPLRQGLRFPARPVEVTGQHLQVSFY